MMQVFVSFLLFAAVILSAFSDAQEEALLPPADTQAAFQLMQGKVALDTAVAAFQYGGRKAVAQPPHMDEKSGYYIFCFRTPHPEEDVLQYRSVIHPNDSIRKKSGIDLVEEDKIGKFIQGSAESIFGGAVANVTEPLGYRLATYKWDNDGDGPGPVVAKTSLIKHFMYGRRGFVCGIQVAERPIEE